MSNIKDSVISLKKKYLNFETLKYIFFGFCAVGVDLGSYSFFCYKLHTSYVRANMLSWVTALLFSYVTNKIFVFKKCRHLSFKNTIKEFFLFSSARLFALIYSLVWQVVAVEWFNIRDFTAKALGIIVVSLINYFTSKLLVFKNKEKVSNGCK